MIKSSFSIYKLICSVTIMTILLSCAQENPTQVSPPPVKPNQVSSPPVKPTQENLNREDLTRERPTQVSLPPVKPTPVSLPPVKPTQVSPSPVKPTQVSLPPVKPTQVSSPPVKPTQVSPSPVKPTQVSPSPVKPTQVSPSPVKPTQVSPSPVKPTQVSPSQQTPTQVGTTRTPIAIDSLTGPVTQHEIQTFKNFMTTRQLPANNLDNLMAYGRAGSETEALGQMYEIIPDIQILDRMIQYADAMLAGRNNPNTGHVMWTGSRELAWPNQPATSQEARFASSEGGDVIAHMVYTSKLILQNPDLWNTRVGVGDPHSFGATYKARALTYITEADRSQDTYYILNFVQAGTNQLRFPTSAKLAALGLPYQKSQGQLFPWNQQMMFNGGLQRLAECHELLGDQPDRVKKYDAIVKTSVDAFINSLMPITVNGHEIYAWKYSDKTRGPEDIGHAQYDIVGLYRAYTRTKYGISRSVMVRFANTVKYVISKGNNQFSEFTNGTGPTRNYLHPYWIFLGDFLPDVYTTVATANVASRRTRTDAISASTILWMKNRRALELGKL